jgi:tellurite resistance protein
MRLSRTRLEQLRDQLQRRGQRPSMVIPVARPDLIEVMEIVEQYGAICEALFLMMAADRRMLNVEREVIRGALDVLSNGRVRTAHMEAMIDAAARRAAEEGEEQRLSKVIEVLARDPVRAETTLLLAAGVAVADKRITPEEHRVLTRLAKGLNIGEERANALLEELTGSVVSS